MQQVQYFLLLQEKLVKKEKIFTSELDLKNTNTTINNSTFNNSQNNLNTKSDDDF